MFDSVSVRHPCAAVPLVLGAFAAVVYLITRGLGWGKSRGHLPPGPPGHWLLGNSPPTSQCVIRETRRPKGTDICIC